MTTPRTPPIERCSASPSWGASEPAWFNDHNIVLQLTAGGAAQADALIRPGDKVMAVDGKPLRASSLASALRRDAAQDTYELTILRDDGFAWQPIAEAGGSRGRKASGRFGRSSSSRPCAVSLSVAWRPLAGHDIREHD